MIYTNFQGKEQMSRLHEFSAIVQEPDESFEHYSSAFKKFFIMIMVFNLILQ